VFTGIVTASGTVRRLTGLDGMALLEVVTELDLSDVRIGDSIAVNGACLSVKTLDNGGFTADVSAESLSRTTLKTARTGTTVNLEKALRVGDRLGGHIVLGHVDGIGKIVEKTAIAQSIRFGFEIEPALSRYVVEKGSVTVDGISLTVNRCEKNRFYVNIIPLTASGTTLGVKKKSDSVNIETDILARYLEKLVYEGRPPEDATGEKSGGSGGIDVALLARYGFMK
jgi:riboflavin synthase